MSHQYTFYVLHNDDVVSESPPDSKNVTKVVLPTKCDCDGMIEQILSTITTFGNQVNSQIADKLAEHQRRVDAMIQNVGLSDADRELLQQLREKLDEPNHSVQSLRQSIEELKHGNSRIEGKVDNLMDLLQQSVKLLSKEDIVQAINELKNGFPVTKLKLSQFIPQLHMDELKQYSRTLIQESLQQLKSVISNQLRSEFQTIIDQIGRIHVDSQLIQQIHNQIPPILDQLSQIASQRLITPVITPVITPDGEVIQNQNENAIRIGMVAMIIAFTAWTTLYRQYYL
jgi:hypothetical protein